MPNAKTYVWSFNIIVFMLDPNQSMKYEFISYRINSVTFLCKLENVQKWIAQLFEPEIVRILNISAFVLTLVISKEIPAHNKLPIYSALKFNEKRLWYHPNIKFLHSWWRNNRCKEMRVWDVCSYVRACMGWDKRCGGGRRGGGLEIVEKWPLSCVRLW